MNLANAGRVWSLVCKPNEFWENAAPRLVPGFHPGVPYIGDEVGMR